MCDYYVRHTMDSTNAMDKLLNQLEELKQKKACKERKLMKIKSCRSKLYSHENVKFKNGINCSKPIYENACSLDQCLIDSGEKTKIVGFDGCFEKKIAASPLYKEIPFREKLDPHFTSSDSVISCAKTCDSSEIKVVPKGQSDKLNATCDALKGFLGKNKIPSSKTSADFKTSLSSSNVEAFDFLSVGLLSSQEVKDPIHVPKFFSSETGSANIILNLKDTLKNGSLQSDPSLTHHCKSQLDICKNEIDFYTQQQNFGHADKLCSTQNVKHATGIIDEAETGIHLSSSVQIFCSSLCDKENHVSELLHETIVKVSEEVDGNDISWNASSTSKKCDTFNKSSCKRQTDEESESVFSSEGSLNCVSLKQNPCKHQDKAFCNFDLVCTLPGARNQRLLDSEVVLFNGVKFAIILHAKAILIWRQEEVNWVKIYSHFAKDRTSFEQMCILSSVEHLVVVMLSQGCCLHFLLFKKDENLLKVMENTHKLDESFSGDSVLLCGLDGLIFATSQRNEISLHTLTGLKETPHLISILLGYTDGVLHSLCKIANLPNALMAVSGSMLYIWHILEARLVTSVSLHPETPLTIKSCFWAAVENGLIYILTACEGVEDYEVCRLLAANLATGFCQNAMFYRLLPFQATKGHLRIVKAVYAEPFLVLAHQEGVLLWSIFEEFCCAEFSSSSKITTVSLCKDNLKWNCLAIGDFSCLKCFKFNW